LTSILGGGIVDPLNLSDRRDGVGLSGLNLFDRGRPEFPEADRTSGLDRRKLPAARSIFRAKVGIFLPELEDLFWLTLMASKKLSISRPVPLNPLAFAPLIGLDLTDRIEPVGEEGAEPPQGNLPGMLIPIPVVALDPLPPGELAEGVEGLD
jgi:hypothetical protein